MESGSLAIWYQWVPARKGQSPRAEAEIHVNFWRRRVSSRFSNEETLLDIGLKLRHSSSVKSFNLFLPFSVAPEEVLDLGLVLKDHRTLMAVFNEAYDTSDPISPGSFPIRDKSGNVVLVCHALTRKSDFAVTTRQYRDGPGTIIHFDEALCARFDSDQDQYIRFRIILSKSATSVFSFHQHPADGWLQSAMPREEVVEFRFNERRSLPQEVVDKMYLRDKSELFKITGLHYFLIRESDVQFVMAQTDFHKVRMLETPLWSRYLEGTKGGALRYPAFIYHWKKIADPGGEVGDFNSLSKFRRIVTGWRMLFYVVVVLIIGIIGNLIAAVVYDRYFAPSHSAPAQTCPCPAPAAPRRP
jgi:hypothetical protein